ncbi:MAG: alanine--tRNA ligase [bacterium]
MQSNEIRQRFLAFFEKRGHNIIPSASLVPENDPSVLFNTAGMQPLVPYLMGAKHPMGTRIADVQKCVRTGDLDDIGDNRHFSFFEMMGNWSLGDLKSPDGIGTGYFKEDAIKWSYEFLTSKEEGLGLDVNRLYVTIFEGDENAPFDEESKNVWMSLGIPEHRIYALPADDNWWSPGDNGPCGPCSEMFYDMQGGIGDLSKEGFIEAVQKEDIIEIWNDVFMEYKKKDGKVIGKLAQKNVDTGAGLERITAVMQGKKTAYDTDLLADVLEKIKSEAQNYNENYARVITDHLRTALFMVADGVLPSNKDRGYILRRLIRRSVVRSLKLSFPGTVTDEIIKIYIEKYKNIYPEVNLEKNTEIIRNEIIKFKKTVEDGIKEFEKGVDPFILATTYGFPIELTEELAKEKGISVDRARFDKEMDEHKKLSQSASAGMFKGGLANTNEQTTKLHTAHHLLLKALQEVLGSSVHQKGSNITEERLRIDFSFDRKMTDEEKAQVESIVNEQIQKGLNVVRRELPLEEAMKLGAEMEFGAKYPEVVSVYFIEDEHGNVFSKEFCGGPHITNTKEIGHFKIGKEEAVAQGIRRIKATIE